MAAHDRQRWSAPLSYLASALERTQQPILWSVLLVATAFYGALGLIVWSMHSGSGWEQSTATRHQGQIESPSQISKQASFAKVQLLKDCQWADGSRHPIIAESLGREPLRLKRGIAELRFASGAEVVLEGPVEFVPQTGGKALLKQGRLVARVPKRAVGFTIETPTANVIDLGTEFGVEVVQGQTDVHVFQGTVEFSQNTSEQPGRNNVGTLVRRLRAGEAAQIGIRQGPITSTEFVPSKFVRQSTRAAKSAPRLRWVDLTKGCAATQSSEFHAYSMPATAAIDGDPTTFSHTAMDDSSSWWQLDLGSTRPIGFVVLGNRTTGLGWLRDITVKVIAEDGKTVVASSPTLNPKNSLGGGELDFDGGPRELVFDVMNTYGELAVGRFVRVERESCVIEKERMRTSSREQNWLTACPNTLVLSEVQVFESPAEPAGAAPRGTNLRSP